MNIIGLHPFSARAWLFSALGVILLVHLVPGYGHAQETNLYFTEHGRYTVGEKPQGISAGDLDGDGKLDLVIPCYDSDIAVVLGDGTGAFGAPSFYNGGYRETATPVLADFNNDGNLDAAISNNDASSFSCLLGNGTGTLTTVYSGSTGSYPHQITGGDFNADGIPDVATISWLGFRLTVFIGKGDGTFSSQQYPMGTNLNGVAAGDFNGDGKLDIAVSVFWSGQIAQFWGNGNGAFTEGDRISVASGGHPHFMIAGDFNNDGVDDISVGVSEHISIFLGTASGNLTSKQDITGYTASHNQMALADLDQDGTLDIADIDSESDDLVVLTGNGDGTFSEQFRFDYTDADIYCGVGVGDFNGDGLSDIALGMSLSGNDAVSILINKTSTQPSNGAPPLYWTRIADLPGQQHASTAQVIDGNVYMIGGQNEGPPPNFNKMRIYDPDADSWSDGPSMPTRRYWPGSGVIEYQGKRELYVIGGYSGYSGLSTVERYIDDDWTTPGDGHWESVTSISGNRGHGIMCAVINNNLYAIGGFYNHQGYYNTNQMYDRENNTWVTKTPLPYNMQAGLPAVYGGKIYIFGGHGYGVGYNSALIYDPESDKWSYGADVPHKRNFKNAVCFSDYIYLIAGTEQESNHNIIDVYHPASDTWSTIDDYPGNNSSSHIIAQNDKKVYVLGDSWNNPGKLECWVGIVGGSELATFLTLTSPNGGEIWTYGNHDITWESYGVTNVKIEYNVKGGQWQEIVNSTPAESGKWIWYVPITPSDSCLVKISDVSDLSITDQSDSLFTMRSLVLISPDSGENLIGGTQHYITWLSAGIGDITIEYSIDDGLSWIYIDRVDSSIHEYLWNVPLVQSDKCKVHLLGGTISSASYPAFTISQPGVTIAVDAPEYVPPGDSFWVDIIARDVQNLFGVSFELSYTQGDYVDVELVESGDFLGSDIIFYPDTDEEAGKISVGMSRKAGQGEVDGSGVLVRVQFTSGSETPAGTVIDFSLSEITANDEDGSPLTLTGEGGSTILQSGLTVWPGDTNNDGTVNQADILPLGVYWGSTGPERTGGSNSWTGQPCFPWSPEAATYADATGNGKVNQEDVLPIGLNWDKTHTVSKIAVHKAVSANGSIKPVPVIEAPEKTGEEFWVEIMVEDVSSLFGLSFVVSYDNKDKIEPVTVENNDFLGDDIVFFPRIDSNSGDIAVGVSRKSGQDGVGGSGVVAKIKFRILKDFGENPAITFYLNDVVANDQTGKSIELEIENGHIGGVHVDEKELPGRFSLSQNHPNPFNPVTVIPFALPRESRVKLTIYNITGEKTAELAGDVFPAGKHSVEWDAGGFSSGVYFYKIEAGKFVDTKKLLLLK